jgi:hypothetical protein
LAQQNGHPRQLEDFRQTPEPPSSSTPRVQAGRDNVEGIPLLMQGGTFVILSCRRSRQPAGGARPRVHFKPLDRPDFYILALGFGGAVFACEHPPTSYRSSSRRSSCSANQLFKQAIFARQSGFVLAGLTPAGWSRCPEGGLFIPSRSLLRPIKFADATAATNNERMARAMAAVDPAHETCISVATLKLPSPRSSSD